MDGDVVLELHKSPRRRYCAATNLNNIITPAPMKNVLTVAEARILLLTGSSPQVKSFVLSLWFPVPLGLRQSLLSAPWSIPFTPAKILRSSRTSMDIPLVLSWKELSPYYITSPSYPPCLSGYTCAREDTRITILNTLRHEGRLI